VGSDFVEPSRALRQFNCLHGTAGDDSPYSKEVAQAVGITSMPMLRQPVYTVEPQSAPEPITVIGFGPVWENLVLNRFRVFFLDMIYVL
jgi:hypothetical protein